MFLEEERLSQVLAVSWKLCIRSKVIEAINERIDSELRNHDLLTE